MSSNADLDAFDSRLRSWMLASMAPGAGQHTAGEDFGNLALKLFALQFDANPPYRSFCTARGVTPDSVSHWTQIPPMPAAGFKEFELSCLPVEERSVVFHSSGTSAQRPSRHFHSEKSLRLYEASLGTWFRAHFVPELARGSAGANVTEEWKFIFLTPPPLEAPHSSLVHMFETIRRATGASDSAFLGGVIDDGGWGLNGEATVAALKTLTADRAPAALLGTAFSLVHLLDHMRDKRISFQLPGGSRLLETGGYKGRSRILSKSELYASVKERLGIPETRIVTEYGMSELSSQAYDAVAGMPNTPRVFHFPPWARCRVVSPETGREVSDGQMGLLRIADLANVYSVMAIQTEDLAIRRGEAFELIGRAVAAEPRGCSLMTVPEP